MPPSSTPSSGDSEDTFNGLVRQKLILSRERRSENVQSNNVRSHLQEALDISTAIISGAEEEQRHAFATRLANRHMQHYLARDLVGILSKFEIDKKNAETIDQLKSLRSRANESGFFLMPYTTDMMIDRLSSPEYVIAESYGRHPKGQNSLTVPAADCQCWLPEAVKNPLETIELPVDGDEIYDRDFFELIATRPWSCAEVKDITTSMQMQNLRMAGAARHTAFQHISHVINPKRGEYPIQFVAATIASVTGMETPHGQKILFVQDVNVPAFKNERSIIIHTSSRNPASHVYTLKNRTVDVVYDGQQYRLIVDWFGYVHAL